MRNNYGLLAYSSRTMQTHFDKDLADLKEKLLTMGSLAAAAVKNSIKSLVDRDDDLARKVKEDDDLIDKLEMEVDEMAIVLLSHAPLATDLRLITVAMKISQNLERIGDEASAIAKRVCMVREE